MRLSRPHQKIVVVGLKMYFSVAKTLRYCEEIRRGLVGNEKFDSGDVRVAVIPNFVAIPAAVEIFRSTPVMVGAQNVASFEHGPYTGEVSATNLFEVGCVTVEIGHVERRRLFHETDEDVREKTRLSLAAGLIPFICIGEEIQSTAENAVAACMEQTMSALQQTTDEEVWLVYEPIWAIGAEQPAPPAYIREVCGRFAKEARKSFPNAKVLYGGSAGPGLLKEISDAVDGIALGRFAHDPRAFLQVVDEAGSR